MNKKNKKSVRFLLEYIEKRLIEHKNEIQCSKNFWETSDINSAPLNSKKNDFKKFYDTWKEINP